MSLDDIEVRGWLQPYIGPDTTTHLVTYVGARRAGRVALTFLCGQAASDVHEHRVDVRGWPAGGQKCALCLRSFAVLRRHGWKRKRP